MKGVWLEEKGAMPKGKGGHIYTLLPRGHQTWNWPWPSNSVSTTSRDLIKNLDVPSIHCKDGGGGCSSMHTGLFQKQMLPSL